MAVKQNPFKPGDKIRCINDENVDILDAHYLVKGHEYTVSELDSRLGEHIVVLDVPHKHKSWYAKRFELVTP